jgi:hypothetical protein
MHRSNGRRAFIEEEMARRAPKWRGVATPPLSPFWLKFSALHLA